MSYFIDCSAFLKILNQTLHHTVCQVFYDINDQKVLSAKYIFMKIIHTVSETKNSIFSVGKR